MKLFLLRAEEDVIFKEPPHEPPLRGGKRRGGGWGACPPSYAPSYLTSNVSNCDSLQRSDSSDAPMPFLKCPSDLQCIEPTAAVKATCWCY